MPSFDDSAIYGVAVHRVGNQAAGESLALSEGLLPLDDRLRGLLLQYFITPFKVQEYYHLGDQEGHGNEVLEAVEAIFDDPESLLEESRRLAELLFGASTHPNIKSGDLFVVYFDECQINGEVTNAVGLFKAENQSQFLKVLHGDGDKWESSFRVEADQGIDIKNLDKGALIFNSEREKGCVVSVVDATNRSADAAYWRDTFLGLVQRQDEYFNTHAELTAYKKFVTDELPQQFEGVSSADRADLLNKSVKYFKQNDNFDVDSFAEEVIQQPEVIESFKEYRRQYSEEHQTELPDEFAISEEAVKKQSRVFKSVIKLDKNFHIYVHGNRELIEQGEDEKGKFYKVYYHQES